MRSVKTDLGVVSFDVDELVLTYGQDERRLSCRKWYQGELGDYDVVIQWWKGQEAAREYKHVFLLEKKGDGIRTIGGGPLLEQAVGDIERLFGVKVKLSPPVPQEE